MPGQCANGVKSRRDGRQTDDWFSRPSGTCPATIVPGVETPGYFQEVLRDYAVWHRLILLTAFGAMAQTTNALSDAEIHGRQLAQQLWNSGQTDKFHQHWSFANPRASKANATDIAVGIQSEFTLRADWHTALSSSGNEPMQLRLLVIHDIELMR